MKNSPPPQKAWCKEKESKYRELIKNNPTRSFSWLGAQMGVSRNAAIGKAHRLGIFSQKTRKPIAEAETGNFKKSKILSPTLEVIHSSVDVVPLHDPSGAHYTIATIQSGCRWPYGDPQDRAFHVCAHPVSKPGGSWCLRHEEKLYQPGTRPKNLVGLAGRR